MDHSKVSFIHLFCLPNWSTSITKVPLFLILKLNTILLTLTQNINKGVFGRPSETCQAEPHVSPTQHIDNCVNWGIYTDGRRQNRK